MKITKKILDEHNLTKDDLEMIKELIGREPNLAELGIFGVMWSEHCSYRSSKRYLKHLYTEGDHVIHGPGQNAGVIDIGDDDTIVFKMESHNHPSFIDPYHGASTGVGGILRDVFTMGARPIALLNSLKFGDPSHIKTKHLVSGVVAGIGDYGNCVGVPTVGGECDFDESYNGNNLVNAMAVGYAKKDKIYTANASEVGSLVVYVGSKTGREGINAAVMASAEFAADSEEKFETMRPDMQMGAPFTEKLLIEACLELMQTDAIFAIQDMGAAGLTCSSFEMASQGQTGVDLDLDKVPLKEDDMTPYEIMLSETQERMLMSVDPEKLDIAQQIFDKWELPFAVVGKITNTGRVVVTQKGEIVIDLPVKSIVDNSPEDDLLKLPKKANISRDYPDLSIEPEQALLKLLGHHEHCSKRWIYEQYDHTVMGDTLIKPGSDAAVIRIHGTKKAIAVTADSNPWYCSLTPHMGSRLLVGEAYRNMIAVGAKPLALTNCLNFGSPKNPGTMDDFASCVEGITEMCKELRLPIVSGDVSFYNETAGKPIMPTPVIGGVGLIEDYEKMMTMGFKNDGDLIVRIGAKPESPMMGQSSFYRNVLNRYDSICPLSTASKERQSGRAVLGLIEDDIINACHDVSSGGLYIALAEMAIKGDIGATINLINYSPNLLVELFEESPARYIVTLPYSKLEELDKKCYYYRAEFDVIGLVGGAGLQLSGRRAITLKMLNDTYNEWFEKYMGL